MFDALVGSVFLFLILFGTVAVCYLIMLKLLIPETDGNYYIVLPCNNYSRNVRKIAYSMKLKLNMLGDDRFAKVVVLDSGMNDSEKADLLEICKECNGIYLVEKEYLKDYFDGRI